MKIAFLKNKIWFFDLDDTLISTMGVHKQACVWIGNAIAPHFGSEIAKEVENLFCHYFELMFDAYHMLCESGWKNACGSKNEYEELIERIKIAQKNVIQEYGCIKKWSREVLIKLALETVFKGRNLKFDNLNPNIIYEAANAYWKLTLDKMYVFEDAKKLLESLHSKSIPIFIATSSDGRLLINKDGEFYYDPIHSESLKRKRMEKMRDRGLIYNEAIIGDPEDKPSIDYFQKCLIAAEENLNQKISIENCIMVGDSYEGDLKIPLKELNFGLVVLIDRNNTNSHFIDNDYFQTHSLCELIS